MAWMSNTFRNIVGVEIIIEWPKKMEILTKIVQQNLKSKQIWKPLVFMYRNNSWNKMTTYGRNVQNLYKKTLKEDLNITETFISTDKKMQINKNVNSLKLEFHRLS